MPAQLQRSMMGLWCTLRLRLWLDRALGSVLLARDLAERIFLDDLDESQREKVSIHYVIMFFAIFESGKIVFRNSIMAESR
jgi:hypothetical protein